MGQVELSQIIKNERFWKFILYFILFFRKYDNFDIFKNWKLQPTKNNLIKTIISENSS